MNCCGKKRQNWLAGNSPTKNYATIVYDQSQEPTADDRSTRWFEYQGDDSLNVKGTGTGITYHFKFKGHKLPIDPRDLPTLMNEKGLTIITRTDKKLR